jgi:hypothetical protein
VEHLEAQEKERVDAGEIWRENGLVFPTSVGTPMEPRSLNRHFDRVRARPDYPACGSTTSAHGGQPAAGAADTPARGKAIARHADIDVTMSTSIPTST